MKIYVVTPRVSGVGPILFIRVRRAPSVGTSSVLNDLDQGGSSWWCQYGSTTVTNVRGTVSYRHEQEEGRLVNDNYIKKKKKVVEATTITSSGLDNVKDMVKINSNHYDIHRQRDRRRGFKTGSQISKNLYPESELE